MSYTPRQAYNGANESPAGEPTLDQPYRGATIQIAARRFFSKYATFSGRASRSEFWWWYLISIVIAVVLRILSSATGGHGGGFVILSIISGLWSLAILVPSLALAWRRLHDTNRSGLWILIGLIPLVGWIILIVFYASAERPEGARFDR